MPTLDTPPMPTAMMPAPREEAVMGIAFRTLDASMKVIEPATIEALQATIRDQPFSPQPEYHPLICCVYLSRRMRESFSERQIKLRFRSEADIQPAAFTARIYEHAPSPIAQARADRSGYRRSAIRRRGRA